MPTKFYRQHFNLIAIIFLLFPILFYGCRNIHHQDDFRKSYKESLISSKWKLQEVDGGIEYFIEFRDSLYIAQYYWEQDRFPKMYPGEWRVNGDTLFISDKRGNFSLFFYTLNDSLMILQRTDSVMLLFDRIVPKFKWE